MPSTKPFSELAAQARTDPVQRARIETAKRAMAVVEEIAELRARKSQAPREVAGTVGGSRANAPRIEHEEDLYLSTLRDYVEALGGRLEINAVFADGVVTLVGAGP